MKLYAWQPQGHGELSWFVCAESEDSAREAVQREMSRRLALDEDDPERITSYEVGDWGSNYFTLTVAEPGQVLTNNND